MHIFKTIIPETVPVSLIDSLIYFQEWGYRPIFNWNDKRLLTWLYNVVC